jgi:hypothetical protein
LQQRREQFLSFKKTIDVSSQEFGVEKSHRSCKMAVVVLLLLLVVVVLLLLLLLLLAAAAAAVVVVVVAAVEMVEVMAAVSLLGTIVCHGLQRVTTAAFRGLSC